MLFAVITITLSVTGINNVQAQSDKKVLKTEDVELWRNNTVTLSDDGNWYTVLYSLTEKPEQNGDAAEEKDDKEIQDIDFYGKDARTDVLYISNVTNGIIYQVPGGSNPQFSSSSQWIAYIKEPKTGKEEKGENNRIIELKNLKTGDTLQYKSDAAYRFAEDKEYFITSDKNSLLVYDLQNRREHYIGNTGEFLMDKKSEYIAYTISSEDKRGNGIYLFNPVNMTTRALQTGNFIYSNLAWNKERTALAAIKYNQSKEKIDYSNMSIIIFSGIDSEHPVSSEYIVKELQGMPEKMGPAVNTAQRRNEITWSNDNERLFIKITEYDNEKEKDQKGLMKNKDESTVSVWHWKDEKLLSQKMLEEERNMNEVFDALFIIGSKRIIQLTSSEIQRLITSNDTDNWAVGTDNREYISDWDVRRNDLYKINLKTGDKKLIEKKYSGSVELSPDGEKIILWKDDHYWYYNLENDVTDNITSGMEVSFISDENDHYGSSPAYGFVGWVKDQNAVIVNHKLDLWLLPLDSSVRAENLTNSNSQDDPVRFRFDDMSFKTEPEIPDRYIDLSSPIILSAFNIKTKYAGYYKFEAGNLQKLIYKPAFYSGSSRFSGLIKADKSDAIIFRMGNYEEFPEAYLSDLSFSKPKKITNSNPQQDEYMWGHRILFDYTNDDGVPLQGVLSIPDNYKKGQKLPMVVYSYEKLSQGMYQYATPALSGSSICEMMYVSDGYLFLRPDIHFNIGTPHSDMHECIDAAIEKVIELGYVDEEHIGYEGFSYGGHTGMYISTQENRFAAIAAGAGVSNLVQGFNIDLVGDGSNEQDYYMTGQGRLGTDPTSNTAMFISESAVFNAATMNTPLLLFHGTADNVVQWEHSFGFYSILRYLKKPVVFLSYQGEGHGLRKKSNRVDIQIRLKEYFDYYLKGKEAGEWITDGLPYQPKDESKEKETARRSVPVWK